jgi:hypothetical protein
MSVSNVKEKRRQKGITEENSGKGLKMELLSRNV